MAVLQYLFLMMVDEKRKVVRSGFEKNWQGDERVHALTLPHPSQSYTFSFPLFLPVFPTMEIRFGVTAVVNFIGDYDGQDVFDKLLPPTLEDLDLCSREYPHFNDWFACNFGNVVRKDKGVAGSCMKFLDPPVTVQGLAYYPFEVFFSDISRICSSFDKSWLLKNIGGFEFIIDSSTFVLRATVKV